MAHSTPSTTAAVVGLQPPKSPTSNASDTLQESARAIVGAAASYAAPTPPFSYNVAASSMQASGSSQQSSPTPVMKTNQPASVATHQPPGPGQPSDTGPSFSYNINAHNNVDSFSSQQFQTNSAIGSGLQGDKSTPQPSAASVQSPVQAQAGHPNLFIRGTSVQHVQDPVPSPVPVPKGAPSIAAGFSFSRASKSLAAVDSLQKDTSSNSNTSGAAAQVAGTAPPVSSSSQSVPLPAHSSASSLLAGPAPPNLYPTNIWMPAAPSISGPPGMPRTPGPPGIPSFAPLSSNITVRPTAMDSSSSALQRAIISSTSSLPSNPTGQQLVYPSYPSLLAMAPPPQAAWLQPPPIGGLPRPPFLPYSGVLPGPFPSTIRGVTSPSVPLPNSQAPAISLVGAPGSASSSVASGPPASNYLLQPELPPGIDHDKKPDGDGTTVANEDMDAWTAHRTETGTVYYYNSVTGESTYEKPSGFKGEPDKVTVQPTPVSMEKFAGTDWALVTTDDGKKYYYNDKTKTSSWQIPKEVTELRKKQDGGFFNGNTIFGQNASESAEKGPGHPSLSAPAVSTGGRDATALRPSAAPGSSSALDLIKKKLQDSGLPVASSPLPASSGPTTSDLNGSKAVDATVKGPQGENSKDRQKDANGDRNMSDSSSDSEDEDSGPTKEECIIQFKEMLKERGVAPFSKWEKELPKIVFDPRFKAVPGYSARRSLFEHYVRTRAEEERKEKRAAQKAAVEGFKQLLEEASEDIDHKTDYQSFKKKWGNDPRFEALDRKEREVLLNERVLPLKKAAEEKIQAIRAAAAASFKSMLCDKEDITTNTRWSRVKDSLRNDPRYKSVKHEDREILFNEYISEMKAAEEEVERVSKAKREEQDKLRERERETRKRKEREEQEMERVRLKVRRKEAVASYQALLVETIKDPQASWTESKPRLDKDPQGRASNPDLDQSDMEKLFREHVKMLYERCAREFQSLLAEVITAEVAAKVMEDGKTALTSWSTAKHLLKPDPRFSKISRKDRESLWRRYTEEMLRKQNLTSEPKEDKLYTETKSRSSLDSGKRSPGGSRRTHGRR